MEAQLPRAKGPDGSSEYRVPEGHNNSGGPSHRFVGLPPKSFHLDPFRLPPFRVVQSWRLESWPHIGSLWDLDGAVSSVGLCLGRFLCPSSHLSPHSSHFSSFVQIKPKRVTGLLITQRMEWNNISFAMSYLTCFQHWCLPVLSWRLTPWNKLYVLWGLQQPLVTFSDPPHRTIESFYSPLFFLGGEN